MIFLILIISGKFEIEVNLFMINLFLMSGIIGIGLGDIVFFYVFKNIGVRRIFLMGILFFLIIVLFGLVFLEE